MPTECNLKGKVNLKAKPPIGEDGKRSRTSFHNVLTERGGKQTAGKRGKKEPGDRLYLKKKRREIFVGTNVEERKGGSRCREGGGDLVSA